MKAAFAIFLAFFAICGVSSQDRGETSPDASIVNSDATSTVTKKSKEEIKAAFEKASVEINATKEIFDKAKAKVHVDTANFNNSREAIHKARDEVNAAKEVLNKKRGNYIQVWEKFNKSRNALRISRDEFKQTKLQLDNVKAKNNEAIQDYRKLMEKAAKEKVEGGVRTEDNKGDTTAKGGVRTKDGDTTAKGSIGTEEKKEDATAKGSEVKEVKKEDTTVSADD